MEKTAKPISFGLRQDKYQALEDIHSLLGLAHEELALLFELLGKAEHGRLDFRVGNTEISFQSWRGFDSSPNEITVEVETKEKDSTRIVKYAFQNGLREGRK